MSRRARLILTHHKKNLQHGYPRPCTGSPEYNTYSRCGILRKHTMLITDPPNMTRTSIHTTSESAALFREIESHRRYLLRYALAKLRDGELAEEAVQETLLSALNGADGFAGDASLRTWLTSILKFKIIDCQRRLTAERERFVDVGKHDTDLDDASNTDWFDQFFDATGHWGTQFADWAQPHAALEQKKLFEVFEQCMDKLPPTAARVFLQREVMGEETEEICKAADITPSNCWVILHRARVSLRECLEINWFGQAR
jgi:RNA polymerase sigma-70 factor, ECF subfamily